MQQAGFKPMPDSQGRLALYDYTLTTNTKDCDINARSVELIMKVAPCSDIGEAMKSHEQKHIDPAAREGVSHAERPWTAHPGTVQGPDPGRENHAPRFHKERRR
jgi:hypothetical protein